MDIRTSTSHEFNLESVLYESNEARNLLLTFLKTEYLTEIALFFEKTTQLRNETQIQHPEELKKQMDDLVSQFLVENSTYELNLSGEVKTKFFTQLSLFKQQSTYTLESVVELLDIIERPTRILLAFDVFPRFVRSSVWNNYIQSLDTQTREVFLAKVTRESGLIDLEKKFRYTVSTIWESKITERDFQFLKYITEDSLSNNWKLISFHKKHGMAFYVNLTKSFIVDELAANEMKHVMMFKYVSTIPFNAETAIQAFAGCDQNIKKSIVNLEQVKHLEFVSREQNTTGDVLDDCPSQAKIRSVFSFPLLSKREAVAHVGVKKEQLSNGLQAYYFIFKTCQHDGVFRYQNSIVPKLFNGVTCTTHPSHPDTQCVLTCFGYLKPGGWISGRQSRVGLKMGAVRGALGKKRFLQSAKYWKNLSPEMRSNILSQCDYTKFLQE